MKKIFTVILFLLCVSAYCQDTARPDSSDIARLKARYNKLQKEYFLLQDELMRYEGRLQELELQIREEELQLQNNKNYSK